MTISMLRRLACLPLAAAAIGGCEPVERDAFGWRVMGGAPTSEVATRESDVIVRRVWQGSEPDFWAAEPSPDGRYVSEIDWTTGNLAFIDLLTGELERVTGLGVWETEEWAESSAFSPDGRQMAYAYYDGATGAYEVRVIDVDGSNERTLLRVPTDAWLTVHAWQDNEVLFVVSRRVEDRAAVEMNLVSVADGSVRTVERYESPWRQERSGPFALSSDGRFLAHSFLGSEGDLDIVISSVSDGSDLARLEGPANDRALGWAPDGHSLLFHSDRGFTEGVWSQPMRDGRPAGPASLLRGGLWGFEPIGASRDEYFFGITTEAPRIWVAAIDPETGAIESMPAPVGRLAGLEGSPVWSPNGAHLAYWRSRSWSTVAAGGTLVIRSADGDEVRELDMPFSAFGVERWTEDGALYGMARDHEAGMRRLFRVELETGSAEIVPGGDGIPSSRPEHVELSADGSVAYFVREAAADRLQLSARDLVSGEETTLGAPVEGVELDELSISPDGRQLAASFTDLSAGEKVVAVVPTAGGSLRELHRMAAPLGSFVLDALWSPSGDRIFAGAMGEGVGAGRRFNITVPATGAAVDVQEIPMARTEPSTSKWHSAAMSPDGRRLAFRAGTLRGEIWLLKQSPAP